MIVALPALLVILYSGVERRNEDIEEAHEGIVNLTNTIATAQKNLVAGAQQLTGVLAQLPDVKSHNSAKTDRFLADILKMNPQYLNIFIADAAGTMWASALPMKTHFSVADRRYFKNSLATGRFSSGGYMVGRMLGKPTMSFGYPYTNERGVVAGIIAVNFDLDYCRGLLEQSKLPAGSSYLLIDHKGVILDRGIDPTALVGKSVKPQLIWQMQMGTDLGVYTGIGVDGIERFSSYQKLTLAGEQTPYMYIRVAAPVNEIVANANRSLLFDLTLLSLFMTIALSLAWIIGKRSIVDRVTLLEKASQRVAKGNLDVRVSDLVVGGELGRLGQTFDAMSHQLARRERELRDSEKFLSTIIETEPDCVKLVAADGSLLMLNRAGLDMIEVESFEQVKGKSIYKVLAPEYVEPFKEMVTDVFAGKSAVLTFKLVGAKGRPLWLETHSAPLRNNSGEIVSLLGITHNVTDRVEMDRMKDEIISSVSHEMRTPLTAILGYLQYISENKLDEALMRQYIGTVLKETERLEALIDSFLDIQRLQANGSFYNLKPLQVRPLLEEVATLFANTSNKHPITIEANTEPLNISGDESGLHRVLINLLSNAIKYSPNGGKVVLGASQEENAVKLWVKDEGIGIAQHEHEKVYDRFYRVDNSARRATGGTGLGLAIVREIVTAHGGRTWVESLLGEGSTFYIALPAMNDDNGYGGRPLTT